MVKYKVRLEHEDSARSKIWFEYFESDEHAKELWYEARHKESRGARLTFIKVDPNTLEELDIRLG